MKNSIMKDKNSLIKKIFIFVFWIGIWQIIHLIIGRDIYVPSPLSVFIRLSELIFLKTFWISVANSIYRVVLGIFLSILIGALTAVISSLSNFVYNLIQPLMTAIKSTPVLSFIIIALIWFSSGNVPIFICFLMCYPVIWTNLVAAIKDVDKNLLEMAEVYKVKKSITLKKVYIPSILPYFSAACITCLGLGWKVSVAAEVLSHPKNAIGSNLYSAKVYLDSSELFAWTLVVILLSFIFEIIFAKIIRKVAIKRSSVKTI
ncbi:ABC transporter permease subunit [Herbivorax sp. ANBcel31]|uniref:ABC transporter permease n=1 Tax=Herbivorax sp. ANBcel31 TaxID=3069754 RepID=UPI0027B80938|nr:ABC transporter permease subunit [Herbivorax sp. ANBcel31]MDQ2085232.1 ABC transporter permease subunit [Herbivorax sp. ANBcel31]